MSNTAKVFVGTLGPVDIWIHVRGSEMIGADLVNQQEGIAVECGVNLNVPNEKRISGLIDGLGTSVRAEKYELAAVVRDTLKALGIDPWQATSN